MCGIAGVFNTNVGVCARKLQNMNDLIKHRGPDDEGFYFWKKNDSISISGNDTILDIKDTLMNISEIKAEDYILGLGHRRLSIIDLTSNGHQPMKNSEIVITFNGEIYNYIEIREQLIAKGAKFVTDGDTEVIIRAYQHWGENCVEYFNGMWSFALWDEKSKKLFCSRDRLGEKPFYYHYKEGEFIFSSEIKQLFEYDVPKSVNEEILFAFLYYGINDYSTNTFFKGVFALQGGFNLVINLSEDNTMSEPHIYQYWKPNASKEKISTDFETAINEIGIDLERSIDLRLRSDVKIGSCLSGGLDSSTIVTLVCEKLKAQNLNTEEFNTFTSCYDHSQEVDERIYSDLIVSNSNCKNFKVKPNSTELENELEKIIWHQDEPFRSMSIFAGWRVMQKAKEQGVKVLLDGQGGDETLLGYERFYAYHLKDLLMNRQFKTFFAESKKTSENSKLSVLDVIKYFVYFNNIKIRKFRLNLRANKGLDKQFIKKYKKVDILDDMLVHKNLEELQVSELTKSICQLLRYEDRNSSAHSIEARVPFLDPDFVEKSISLPNEYKLRDGWTKAILRSYMTNKMPIEVTYRKNKLGFSVPQKKWLDELNDIYKKKLLENPLSSNYFNMILVKESFENKTNDDLRFKFIMIEMWMRVFEIS